MYRYVRGAYRFVTNPGYRNVILLRWLPPKNLFQTSNHTSPDRYPALFRITHEKLGDGPEIRLLSFGCSTGEEVFTLRKYFPNAWIKGIDISPHNIRICQTKLATNPDPKIRFEVADSVEREPLAVYDAVFCMAVFRRGELAHRRFKRCDSLIRFADFTNQVREISRRLKPGGYLLTIHANFKFRDTPTADEFDLTFRMNPAVGSGSITPIFDSQNCRTDEVNCDEVMFRKKRPTASPAVCLPAA